MAVPEAAIYEYDKSHPREDKIRFAEQRITAAPAAYSRGT
jgi:hypothetical protein